jgi:aspartate/methionine/tyrosine aminotransferase
VWQLLEAGGEIAILVPTYMQTVGLAASFDAPVREIPLREELGWQPDPDEVVRAVGPRTRAIVVTNPGNPTGAVLSAEVRRAIVQAAERTGAWILADEVYRGAELGGDETPTFFGTCARVIATGSLSKAYGLPGLRIGWAVCRDPAIAQTLLAAKEQMVICGPTLDEAIAARVLADRERVLEPIRADVLARLAIVREWMAAQSTFEWVEPAGGVVGFVRFTPDATVDTDRFYDTLLTRYGTYVGPGRWFEVSDRHFRLGYGWPAHDELRAGLDALGAAASEASG